MQDLSNLFGICLQPVQNRVLPARELLPTRLALQVPDRFVFPMLPIPHQRMDLFVVYPVVFTFRVRTEIPGS